jgi:Suppressor of fused protein (SUFU)
VRPFEAQARDKKRKQLRLTIQRTPPMGLFDWFRKQRPPAGGEVSPGGSKYIRHGERTASWMPGFPQFSTLPYLERREAVYEQMFGKCALVYDDLFPGLIPHIDVYVHEPGFQGRDFYTLVTGGMSDMPMTMPLDAPAEFPRRAEIVFYLPPSEAPKRDYGSFLSTSARFAYDYQTWLYWGHTIPNGDPPKPIFAGMNFVSVLFLFPLFGPDNKLADHLVLDGDPVHFLWIVPLTLAEHRYKLAHGTEALQAVFNRVRLPFVFDEKRASCV